MDGEDRSHGRRRPRGTFRAAGAILAAALLVVAAALFLRGVRTLGDATDFTLSETTIREAAHAAIQRESPERFLVTGRLDVTATTEVENTRRVLPGLLDLSLGTSTARVRVPGRVYYGVDLAAFERADVRLLSDSVVELTLPDVRVQAVEPLLDRMEVHTDRGWARLPGRSEVEAERRAIALLRPLLHQQGRAHLADARQPRVNTARAVAATIFPALVGAGMRDPVVRVVLGDLAWTVRPPDNPAAPASRPIP